MADEQDERPLRRLFQNLQERVGTRTLHVINGVDNGDAPAALICGRAEKRDSPANVLDTYDCLELSVLLIDHAFDGPQIVLCLRSDAARDRTLRIYGKGRCSLHGGRLRIGMS